LQHASAGVLKRMKRGANGDIFLRLIERIRRTIPGVAIRTSMIVGFPGESDKDFETLCDFAKAAEFDRLGVFGYSDEDTSASFHLDAKVGARIIYLRKRKLMALQRKISRARHRALVGSERTVLVEGPSADSELVWQARVETQAPEIDGVCYISDPGEQPLQAGQFRRMRFTKAHDYDLEGGLQAPLRKEAGFGLALQAKACATILPNPTARNAEAPAQLCSAPFVIRK
jgi:ribosomal protein S12 methylthiotransferase